MRRLAVALVIGIGLLGGPGALHAQPDFSTIRRQVVVDDVLRALANQVPTSRLTFVAEIVPSENFFVQGSGTQVRVSTRFIRDASASALAAAVAVEAFPDPVEAAVVLHRAGFAGPEGLMELSTRVAALRAEQAAVYAAWAAYQAALANNSFFAVARPGVLAHGQQIEAARARYVAALQRYRADVPSAYAMRVVPDQTIAAVAAATAVLRGQVSANATPIGPRVLAVLGAFERANANPSASP